MASQQRLRIEAKGAAVNKWNRLPPSLIASCLSLLGDRRLVLAAQSTCRMWRAVEHAMDAFWRAQYLAEFELESANDRVIANEGANTSWRRRFLRRAQTESNWREARFTTRTLSLDLKSGNARLEMLPQTSQLIVVTGTSLHILSAADGVLVRRWEHSQFQFLRPNCLAADDQQSPAVIAACCHELTRDAGELTVWNVNGQLLRKFESAAKPLCADIRGELAVVCSQRRTVISHWPTGEQLRTLHAAELCALAGIEARVYLKREERGLELAAPGDQDLHVHLIAWAHEVVRDPGRTLLVDQLRKRVVLVTREKVQEPGEDSSHLWAWDLKDVASSDTASARKDDALHPMGELREYAAGALRATRRGATLVWRSPGNVEFTDTINARALSNRAALQGFCSPGRDEAAAKANFRFFATVELIEGQHFSPKIVVLDFAPSGRTWSVSGL